MGQRKTMEFVVHTWNDDTEHCALRVSSHRDDLESVKRVIKVDSSDLNTHPDHFNGYRELIKHGEFADFIDAVVDRAFQLGLQRAGQKL